MGTRRLMGRRTLLAQPRRGLKFYLRREEFTGRFGKLVRVGRALAVDRRFHARTIVRAGYGYKGDQLMPAVRRAFLRRQLGLA